MAVHELESAGDGRLAPYRDLRNRPAEAGDRFIVEGEHLLGRLLASEVELESALVSSRKLPRLATVLPREVPVYVLGDREIEEVVGFKFHRGVLGCGKRPRGRPAGELLQATSPSLRAVACPEITDAENLGSIIRTSGCLGVNALILGERCADAYSRRCIRVSMGAVFSLPIYKCHCIADELAELGARRSAQLVAAVADAAAEPLAAIRPAPDWCLVLGNEEKGLAREIIELCSARVCIPMAEGADSLNVSVAGGILIHHMTGAGWEQSGQAQA